MIDCSKPYLTNFENLEKKVHESTKCVYQKL